MVEQSLNPAAIFRVGRQGAAALEDIEDRRFRSRFDLYLAICSVMVAP
jgi:hypothetical protein